MYQITFTQNVKKVTVHVFLKRESSTELPGSLNFSTTDIFPVLSPVHTNSDKEPINWFHGCKNIKWTQARKVSPQNTKEKTIFLCLWVTLTLHTASYTFGLTENKYIWFEDSWENTNICSIVRMIWILLYRKNQECYTTRRAAKDVCGERRSFGSFSTRNSVILGNSPLQRVDLMPYGIKISIKFCDSFIWLWGF